MIQIINETDFKDAFRDYFGGEYKNNFSYEGLGALYKYLEEYEEMAGGKIELDVIALCCEYSEYKDLDEYLNNYNTDINKKDYDDDDDFNDAVLEEIQDKTTFIKIEGTEGFIIGAY